MQTKLEKAVRAYNEATERYREAEKEWEAATSAWNKARKHLEEVEIETSAVP